MSDSSQREEASDEYESFTIIAFEPPPPPPRVVYTNIVYGHSSAMAGLLLKPQTQYNAQMKRHLSDLCSGPACVPQLGNLFSGEELSSFDADLLRQSNMWGNKVPLHAVEAPERLSYEVATPKSFLAKLGPEPTPSMFVLSLNLAIKHNDVCGESNSYKFEDKLIQEIVYAETESNNASSPNLRGLVVQQLAKNANAYDDWLSILLVTAVPPERSQALSLLTSALKPSATVGQMFFDGRETSPDDDPSRNYVLRSDVYVSSSSRICLDPTGRRIIVMPGDIIKTKNDQRVVVCSTRDLAEYMVESVPVDYFEDQRLELRRLLRERAKYTCGGSFTRGVEKDVDHVVRCACPACDLFSKAVLNNTLFKRPDDNDNVVWARNSCSRNANVGPMKI